MEKRHNVIDLMWYAGFDRAEPRFQIESFDLQLTGIGRDAGELFNSSAARMIMARQVFSFFIVFLCSQALSFLKRLVLSVLQPVIIVSPGLVTIPETLQTVFVLCVSHADVPILAGLAGKVIFEATPIRLGRGRWVHLVFHRPVPLVGPHVGARPTLFGCQIIQVQEPALTLLLHTDAGKAMP